MAADTGDFAGSQIAIEVGKVRLQVRKGFALREVIGKFIQITQPCPAILPVGELRFLHALNVARSTAAASDFYTFAACGFCTVTPEPPMFGFSPLLRQSTTAVATKMDE
jgi:hypothetical protein